VPKIIKINRICEQPSIGLTFWANVYMYKYHCVALIPDIFVTAKQPIITAQSQVISAHFVYHCTVFYSLQYSRLRSLQNSPLSLHNRKLSVHILCITAQYFIPCSIVDYLLHRVLVSRITNVIFIHMLR